LQLSVLAAARQWQFWWREFNRKIAIENLAILQTCDLPAPR